MPALLSMSTFCDFFGICCKLLVLKPLARPYHHGNLRQELLRAAELALEARGVQELSLRELSRELGVSHASPQRHFASKQDLINALAIMGFERLSSVMEHASQAPGLNFKERITKAALAYVGFACKSPALFALMFEAKRRPGMGQERQAAGLIVPGDAESLALTFGAALHGLVSFSIEGKVKGTPIEDIVPETVQHVLSGLSAHKG